MSALIQIVVILAASGFIGQEVSRAVFGISGTVQYPDGKPSAGATVTGITACSQEPYHLVKTTKTSSDGSFRLPPFDSECNRIQLSASNVEELWLKTGLDVFYPKENGTAPIVDITATGSPTVIILGERGAVVALRVRDAATEQFIWARLHLERRPVPGAKFGTMLFATGRDGSADTLFLPGGEYEISVESYACNGTDYLVANPPRETLIVEAGQRVAKDISLNVRQIKPVRSSDNPHAKPCEPSPHGQ
jgi:hypothetical protein